MNPSDLLPLILAQSWQLAALIAGVVLVNRFAARDRPHLAHALWLVVLLKCVTPPVWSSPSGLFCWMQPRQAASACSADVDVDLPAALSTPEHHSVEVVVAFAPDSVGAVLEVTAANPSSSALSWQDWLVAVWLGGTALSLGAAHLRYAAFVWRLHRYPRRDDPALTSLVAQLAKRLKIGRCVRLLITESRIGPAVIGLWQPTILLPAAILAGKSPTDLEPILAHELLHVRRGDLWLAAAQVLAQALWWFHPLVWLASRLLTREAERCCDEQVLAELCCEPARYARSLLDILVQKHTLLAVPAFPGVRPVDVTSSQLERIMRMGHGCQRRTPRWCWLVMLLATGITLPGAAFVAEAKDPLKQRPKRPRTPPSVAAPSADESNAPVTRLYPVRDLLQRLMDELKIDDAEAREELRGHVIGFAELKEPQLDWEGKKLAATHSEAQQERVAAALAQLREFGVRQIQLSVRMVSGPPELLEKLPVKWFAAGSALPEPTKPPSTVQAVFDFRPLPLPVEAKPGESWTQATSVVEKNMPVLYAVMEPAQAGPLLEAAQGDSRTNVLQAPKVTVFNGQRATVMDARQRPFVVGVKPAAGADPRAPASFEPQIRVVNEGTTLRMRPVLQGRERVRLDYEFTLASIRSVETAKIPQGEGSQPLTVQVPEVASVRFQTSLELPLGKTLAVGALTKQGNKPAAMVVLLEVREIDVAFENASVKSVPKDFPIAPTPRAVAPAGYLQDDVQYFPQAAKRESLLEERLNRQIFAAHGRMELDDAVASISKAAGVNIWLDSKSLAEEGVTPDTPVNVQRQGNSASARKLLAQLLEPLSLEFWIENETVRVCSQSESRKTYAKVYAVADLVAAIPAIVAIGEGKPFSPPPHAKADFGPLLALIRTTIALQSWDTAGGPGALSAYDTNQSLVVSQTQEVHEQIADLLEQLRRLRDQQVALELQLLAVPENFFERVGLDFDLKASDADAPTVHARLSPQQAEALLRAAGAKSRAATRVTLMNGQGGDLDLPLAPTQRKLNLKLVPQIRADRRGIRLNLAAEVDDSLEAMAKSAAYQCRMDEVLLIDVTDSVPTAGVPVLGNIPHMQRLFRQVPPAGSRLLLLVAPTIQIAEESEVRQPEASATQAAKE